MLSIAHLPIPIAAATPAAETINDEPNVALAPEEIATLTSLMVRYDQVLLDIDSLTDRLENLLERETESTAQ
jgi:allophanate hydrolase subunit 1